MRVARKMLAAAGAVAAIVAATAGGATAAHQAGCATTFTEGRGPSALVAVGVTCATARKVSTTVASAAPSGCVVAGGKGRAPRLAKPCVRLGYACASVATRRHTLHVTCTRGARRILFTY